MAIVELKLLSDYLEKYASTTPDKTHDGVSDKGESSYAEALSKTEALARGFLEIGYRAW